MRATIIAADNAVYVDGKPLHVDCSSLDPTISAVQWYDTFGEVEYYTDLVNNTRKPNLHIDDFTPFQSLVDLWTIAATPPPPPPNAAVAPPNAAPVSVIAN